MEQPRDATALDLEEIVVVVENNDDDDDDNKEDDQDDHLVVVAANAVSVDEAQEDHDEAQELSQVQHEAGDGDDDGGGEQGTSTHGTAEPAEPPADARFWGRSKYRTRVARGEIDESSSPMPAHRLVTEPGRQVEEAAELVGRARWLAIDTESDILFVHRPRVCLIQMSVEGGDLLVFDTVALMRADPLALEPIRPHLEDGRRLIFAHGAANDVSTFKRDFNISLNAAQLAGLPRTNYGAVVKDLLSVTLSKDYTHYNWGLRPIDLEALRYALEDVIYLPQVGHILLARVQELGVEEELAAINRMLMAMPAHPRRLDDLSLVHGIRGTGNLDPAQLGVMGALFLWRDAKARALDRPCGSIISNERLVKIARALDANVARRYGRHHAEELVECMMEALLRPPQVPPRPAHRASSSKHLMASCDKAKEEEEEAKETKEEEEEEEAAAHVRETEES